MVKLKAVIAADENGGIAKNDRLPWSIKAEFRYFHSLVMETKDPKKRNITITGRTTWFNNIPEERPFPNTTNFVLTRQNLDVSSYNDTYTFSSLEAAIKAIEEDPRFKDSYEEIWVMGGTFVYKDVYRSKHFHSLYLSRILGAFDCDVYMPPIPAHVKRIKDPRAPEGIVQEGDKGFYVTVYENVNFQG